MKIYSYLAKQWSLTNRDWLNGLFYSVSMPVLYGVLNFIDSQLALGDLSDTRRIAYLAISAGLPHIIRKLKESNKLITMQKVEKEDLPKAEQIVEQANELGVPAPDVATQSDDGDPIPPPIGDPTHPKPPKGDIGE